MTRKFTGPRYGEDSTQLSLFDAPPTLPDVADVPPPVACVALVSAPPAVASVEPVCAVTIASVLTPAVFRHPQADREIRLNEHVVAYALKRARRRSIGFIVGLDGLSEIGRAHV